MLVATVGTTAVAANIQPISDGSYRPVPRIPDRLEHLLFKPVVDDLVYVIDVLAAQVEHVVVEPVADGREKAPFLHVILEGLKNLVPEVVYRLGERTPYVVLQPVVDV